MLRSLAEVLVRLEAERRLILTSLNTFTPRLVDHDLLAARAPNISPLKLLTINDADGVASVATPDLRLWSLVFAPIPFDLRQSD